MKIAVLDDESFFVDQILNKVKEFEINDINKNVYDGYTNPIQFLEAFSIHSYDLIFLDMQMDEMDGIAVANAVREKKKECIIICVSNYDEYRFDSYKVEAFQYINKPINDEQFFSELARAVKKYKQLNHHVLFDTSIGKKYIFTKDIIYLETSYESYVLYTTGRNFYGKTKSLKNVKDDLLKHNFFRLNRSIIINFMYVDAFHTDWVSMANGENITITRKKRKEFRKQYLEFIEKETKK